MAMAGWRIGGGDAFRPDGTGDWRLALFVLLGGALLALILALLLLIPRWLYPPLSSSELQGSPKIAKWSCVTTG